MSDHPDRRVILFRYRAGDVLEWRGQPQQPWRVHGRRYEERGGVVGSGVAYGLAREGDRHSQLQWVSEAALRAWKEEA